MNRIEGIYVPKMVGLRGYPVILFRRNLSLSQEARK
jgi:hypothetical protein